LAAERNEHLVVIMLEKLPAGEEFEVWDRHITLVPWFPCDDAWRLDKLLQKITQKHRSFMVKAGKVEQWGGKDKYEVQKIEDPGDLHSLHWDVFHSLEKNGFPIHQKEFMAEKYTPHIALRNHLQKGNPFGLGEELIISNFSLIKQIRLKKSGRMIKSLVKDYELG
jgi:2'-5' RNA ligase